MDQPETSSAMHENASSAAQPTCDTCEQPFTRRKRWQRFCGSKCRDAFHSAERRKEAIRDRALEMYECLADFASQGNQAATKAIAGLKAPVTPLDLLKERPGP